MRKNILKAKIVGETGQNRWISCKGMHPKRSTALLIHPIDKIGSQMIRIGRTTPVSRQKEISFFLS